MKEMKYKKKVNNEFLQLSFNCIKQFIEMLKSFNHLAKTLETETTIYEKAKLDLIQIRTKEQNLNKEKQRLQENMIAITDEIVRYF